MRVLVTGGVRSGKSAHAESLLAERESVTYLATSPPSAPDDADWARRVAAHRDRRPAAWRTVETLDLAGALRSCQATEAVLVDSLGTWVAGWVDAHAGWDAPTQSLRDHLLREVDVAVEALPRCAVLVTDEVGLGGVAADPSARLFADLLGEVSQRVAAACDEVHLVVAGRVVRL